MFYTYTDIYSGGFLDAVGVKNLVMETIPFGALDCRRLYVSPLNPPFTPVPGEERGLGFLTDFPRCHPGTASTGRLPIYLSVAPFRLEAEEGPAFVLNPSQPFTPR